MWWVVNQPSRPGGPRGPQETNYVVVKSPTRPGNALQGSMGGPYPTQQAAIDARNRDNAYGNNPASFVAQSAKDAFNGLNLGNWLLRIGEIMLGVVLVGVGIAKLTGTTNLIAAAVKTKLPIPV